MRKLYSIVLISIFVLSILPSSVLAQRTCAAHDHYIEQTQKSPKMRTIQDKLEKYTLNYSKSYPYLKATETRTIPVNVIVIYANSQQNISQAQIESQISVLNADYGGTNSDLSGVPSEFTGVTSTGTGIQFVLSNIERHSNSTSSWGTNDAMKTAYPPTSPSTTLNMWICNIGGGILGYAQFPGGAAATDGVVFSPQYCGSSDYGSGFYLDAPFDKGRTATHEVGHYLNLRHIWGDGACSATDYVDDTPSAASANYGCPTHPSSSCSSNDMFMNYMDYTDDACMFMFSAGQEARMWACLNSTRSDLGTPGGNLPPIANANGPYSGDPGVAVNFSSAGSSDADGSIASYAWSFGDGVTSNSANPSHTYATDGNYNVSLTVTDNEGAASTANTNASIGTFCSGISACDGSISLNLLTDTYASETSWTLKNSAGTTIESGSGYSNSTSYTINWSLAEGEYTFTINDSYGDGICCSYGSGSYSLADGCSNTLVSGGSFASSESTVFCVPDGGTPDNIAPVADANGPYAADENQAISFSSAGSSDSDGTITGYSWDFGDGATSTSANPSHSYTTAGTYTVNLTVTDDDGATDTDGTTATISTTGGGETVVLEESYFESGWDGWTDGGSDASRYSGSRSYEGNYSLRIRDNSGSSIITSGSHNVSAHDQITIDFYFYPHSMESGEDFWVRYYNGSSWVTVATYARGTDFSNGNFYQATVTLDKANFAFPTNAQFRFQCDASNNRDYVYIDQVTITASSSGAKEAGATISKVQGISNSRLTSAWNEDINVFPVPASDLITVSYLIDENAKAEIYSIKGTLVKSIQLINDRTEINISDLNNGMYILKIIENNDVFSKKFLKK